MRYIGGKSLMTDHIMEVIGRCSEDIHSVTDMFAGTGVVAQRLKSEGYAVNSNDVLYFSYVLNRGALEMSDPISEMLRSLIEHLNHLTLDNCPWFDLERAFVYQNYSPHDSCVRMYFQDFNAVKIDLIRQEIEHLKNEISTAEYFYLLSLLVQAVPYVANITGTYGAYLKYWDKRTYNNLVLREAPIIQTPVKCCCYNMDAMVLSRQIESDLTYLDPPYNSRQYLSNYHILETIAKYDYPHIKGVTGMRDDPCGMSVFCKRGKAKSAFRRLLGSIKSRFLLLSYNNEGLLTTEEMTQLMKESGDPDTFRLFEFDYRRYKNKIPNNKIGLKEQLYFIRKKL